MKTIRWLLVAGGLLGVLLWQISGLVTTEWKSPLATPTEPEIRPAQVNKTDKNLADRGNAATDREREVARLRARILALLTSANPDDPATANEIWNVLLPELTRLDPRAAAEFAQSAEAAKWRSQLMMVVAQTWASFNPDDAQDWASHLVSPADNPTERDTMVSYVCFSVANTDVNRAVQVLEDCNINPDRSEILVANLAQQWASKDLQPLIDWVKMLAPGQQRDNLIAQIASVKAQTDPAEAGRIVSEDIAPGPIQIEAALNVLRQWAWVDRAAAVDWVNRFPSTELRDRAWNEVLDAIAHKDGDIPPPSKKDESAALPGGTN